MSEYTNIGKAVINLDLDIIDVLSNPVVSEDLNVTVTKSQDTKFIIPNTPHTYRIQIINYRETPLLGATFVDDIPFGLTYIPNTLVVDGVNVNPTIVANTISYIIPTIAASHTVEIEFQVMPS